MPEYSKFTVDFNSQKYLPSSDFLTDCVALETSADSLCFWSFSTIVSRNEDIHTELRVHCVVELAIFREFYMSAEAMLCKMFAQKNIYKVLAAVHGQKFRTRVTATARNLHLKMASELLSLKY